MKSLVLSLVLIGLSAWAQGPTLSNVSTDEETTISIKKGPQGATKSCQRFEIVKSEADIPGEAELLTKQARGAWRKACEEWKKEMRELNAENRVIALNCGTPQCGKMPTGETQCSSKGSYQVRVRIEE